MIRIHRDQEFRDDVADQLARIIWDIHLRLAQMHPFLVPDTCREHGIDFDFRRAS